MYRYLIPITMFITILCVSGHDKKESVDPPKEEIQKVTSKSDLKKLRKKILAFYKEDNDMEKIEKYTKEDIEWLARNIYFEARSENLLGKMVVAFVTLNRVIDRRWPDTIKEVVTQRKQFSWYNVGYVPEIKNTSAYKECKEIAKMCVTLYNDMAEADGYVDDGITKAANHYFADYIDPPYWVKDMEYVGKVGRHLLYKS